MSLQVNTHAASAKALNHTSRTSNLLNTAVNGMSGGVGSSPPRDHARAFGMAESLFQSVFGARKKPSARENPQAPAETDRVVASAGGLARMGGLFPSIANSQSINPEAARESSLSAQLGISGNPLMAIDAQANQRSDAVMKLLE
jgi:hypothetical protein